MRHTEIGIGKRFFRVCCMEELYLRCILLKENLQSISKDALPFSVIVIELQFSYGESVQVIKQHHDDTGCKCTSPACYNY